MKKVLITGVAGFIGSNLADRLLRQGGYEVIGIDNLAAGCRSQVPSAIEFHELDIRDSRIYPLFQGVDTVFHLAAKNCILDCQKDPVQTASVNILGSINVFEAAIQSNVRKMIYAESSSLYEKSALLPTPETEMEPESFYAVSKASLRFWAQSFAKFSPMIFTALRYFCVYGPRQDYRRSVAPVMSAFILQLLQGKRPTIYGSGEKKRDFIYIDDVNDFHMRARTDPRTDHKVFNLGSGQNYSIQEIFEKIASLLKSNLKPLYKSDLPGEAEQTLACINEALSIGWTPKTSLEDGLWESIQFIQENVC